MLRESSLATDTPLHLMAITDRRVDPLVPLGRQLLDLVDAGIRDDAAEISKAAESVMQATGPNGLVDAASVFACFEMMNRVADATGIPIGRGRLAQTADLRAAAGIEVPVE